MNKNNNKKRISEEKFKSLLMAVVLSISSFNIGNSLNKNVLNIDKNNNKAPFVNIDTPSTSIEEDYSYEEQTKYNIKDLYLIDVSMCNNVEDYKDNKFCIVYKKLDSAMCDEHFEDDFTYVYRMWETYYDIIRDNNIYFINEFYSIDGNGEELVPGDTSIDGYNGNMTFHNYDYSNIFDLENVLENINNNTLKSFVSDDGYINREDLKEFNKLLDILTDNENVVRCNTKLDNNTKKLYRA